MAWLSHVTGLHEECGVFGIAGSKNAASITRQGLHYLRHRGQDGAGIVSWNNAQEFHQYKNLGLVSSVFSNECLDRLAGSLAIGHVRYGTTGSSSLANVQPLGIDLGGQLGQLWVAHNGNIVNHDELKLMLEGLGRKFETTSDTELMLHLVALSKEETLQEKVADACMQIHGAFSTIFLARDQMIVARDPYGIRPLAMGTSRDGALVFASETCALENVDVAATFDREVEPGEMVVVNGDSSPSRSMSSIKYYKQPPDPKHCLMELIYLGHRHSTFFGNSAIQFRSACGELLAKECPPLSSSFPIIVVAVPNSAIPAAQGYSRASGLPYEDAILRSPDVPRTFIAETQEMREAMAAKKYFPLQAQIEGKSVILVDDSVVRGTTTKILVEILRQSGAREVHMRIASPPVVDVCHLGVNISTKEELAVAHKSVEEFCKEIGADSLEYLPLKAIIDQGLDGKDHFCTGCFTGKHPKDIRQKMSGCLGSCSHKATLRGLSVD